MKKTVNKIINEQTGLEYKLHKDGLYYPVIKVDKRKNYFVGKYGKMHESYIKENDEVLYNHLLLNGELHYYLHHIDKRTNEMHKVIKEEG